MKPKWILIHSSYYSVEIKIINTKGYLQNLCISSAIFLWDFFYYCKRAVSKVETCPPDLEALAEIKNF